MYSPLHPLHAARLRALAAAFELPFEHDFPCEAARTDWALLVRGDVFPEPHPSGVPMIKITRRGLLRIAAHNAAEKAEPH